jgi:hypothetical protein
MRRTPIVRRSPLRRTPLRHRAKSTSYSRRARDLDRMAWVKQQVCAIAIMELVQRRDLGGAGATEMIDAWRGGTFDGCRRAIEAHHAGAHGLGNKAPDDTCIALCDHHHDALTDRTGCFAGWPRGTVKAWELAAVAFYQGAYAGHLLVRSLY